MDRALGIGGLPRGRIVELYGPESSGKSTIALHLAANAQKLGMVAYVDTEHAIDPVYAAALGVDIDNLLVAQPDNAEQALEIIETLIDSGDVSLIVLDSVAALVTRKELEGDYGDSNVGLMARLMSQAMRKLVGRAERTKTLLLCINQLRMKVGIVYGSPEVTTGGLALRYYASVRMDVRRIETEKAGADAVGNLTRVKVVKNKLAPPLKQATFSIKYGEGISREAELIELGTVHGCVQKKGSWISYNDGNGNSTQLGQGNENARQALLRDPKMASEIEARIREVTTCS